MADPSRLLLGEELGRPLASPFVTPATYLLLLCEEAITMRHPYKGHTIELIPSAEGLMWACQYIIMKSNQTEIAGFPDGNTYDTREDAEAAAFTKAKSLIDESAVSKDGWAPDIMP